MVEVLRDGQWQRIQWQRLQVGDICKVQKDDFFPADLILLASRYGSFSFHIIHYSETIFIYV